MSSRTESATTDRSLPERIVLAIANEKGASPTELTPLYDAIDPDALDTLLRSGTDCHVEFTYEGFDVAARGDGGVDLTPR